MFSNILVPFDIGFMPRLALITAAALAHDGAQVTLLHVTDPTMDATTDTFSVITEEHIAAQDARIRRASGDAISVLSEYRALGSAFTKPGRPVHRVINRFAREIDADVIIMGTHGRRGISRVLWGSVTEDVLREAAVPVIVVRESSGFQPVFEEDRNHV